jgi:hypothetical protein
MSEATELERVRHVLKLARRQIDQGDPKPDLAIEHLRRIKHAIECYPDTPESAEYSLLVGEAFTAKHDPAAESFLREAEDRIARLPDRLPELELRLHDRWAYFCEKVLRSRTRARGHLELAKAAAVNLGVSELTAHAQLRNIRLDLKIDESSDLENFTTLRRVGCEHDYTDEEQLMAWHQYCGDTDSSQLCPVYARGIQKRSEQFFLDLLRSVRVHQ